MIEVLKIFQKYSCITSATKAVDMVKWQSDCLGCTSNHSPFPVPQNKTTQQSNNKKPCCTKQLKTN